MATAAVQHAPGNTLGKIIEPVAQETKPAKHDVATELNYYNDSGDGTLPAPCLCWVSLFRIEGSFTLRLEYQPSKY
jgi:hypothetical protein